MKLARDEERQHDGLAGLRESLLGPVRRREFELWIHRDGNAAALVAIEVELPADRSRPDAGLVTLSVLIGGGNRVLHEGDPFNEESSAERHRHAGDPSQMAIGLRATCRGNDFAIGANRLTLAARLAVEI